VQETSPINSARSPRAGGFFSRMKVSNSKLLLQRTHSNPACRSPIIAGCVYLLCMATQHV
jgi:hypothetical protein